MLEGKIPALLDENRKSFVLPIFKRLHHSISIDLSKMRMDPTSELWLSPYEIFLAFLPLDWIRKEMLPAIRECAAADGNCREEFTLERLLDVWYFYVLWRHEQLN